MTTVTLSGTTGSGNMSNVKKGNTTTLEIAVKDANGALRTDLATATEILFMIKSNKTDIDADAIISKSLGAAEITVDLPETGYLTLSLSATDTNIAVGTYYAGCEVQWPTETCELDLDNEELVITQDIIRG
jgi:hypothetical protein